MSMTPKELLHAHLDVCAQCARQPFDMCRVGQQLLVDAALVAGAGPEATAAKQEAEAGSDLRPAARAFAAHVEQCDGCRQGPATACELGMQLLRNRLVERLATLARKGGVAPPTVVAIAPENPGFPPADPEAEAILTVALEEFTRRGCKATHVLRALLHAAAVGLGHIHQGLESSDQAFGQDVARWFGAALATAHHHRQCEMEPVPGGHVSEPSHRVH